jgi:hypothetical protein
MLAVMQSRLRNLKLVRSIWADGDYKVCIAEAGGLLTSDPLFSQLQRALDMLVDMEDNAVLVDILVGSLPLSLTPQRTLHNALSRT